MQEKCRGDSLKIPCRVTGVRVRPPPRPLLFDDALRCTSWCNFAISIALASAGFGRTSVPSLSHSIAPYRVLRQTLLAVAWFSVGSSCEPRSRPPGIVAWMRPLTGLWDWLAYPLRQPAGACCIMPFQILLVPPFFLAIPAHQLACHDGSSSAGRALRSQCRGRGVRVSFRSTFS